MLTNKEEFNIRKRISITNEFDLVRILLAYCVVFQHSSTILESPKILNVQSVPIVPIFLFISRFLVSESLLFSYSIFAYFLYWKLERKFLDKNSHSYKLLN